MSSSIQNPHDRFFRVSMGNPKVALEFVNTYIPASLAAKIDPGSLQLAPGTFIEEGLQEWKTDVLYKTTFQGTPGYIYLLIEHQRKEDRLMPLRMLEYTLKIIRAHLKEHRGEAFPLVYPCVLYNGPRPYAKTTDVFELFADSCLAREIFLKPFQLIDLTQISDEDLKKQPLLGIVALFLKHAFTRNFFRFIKSISGLLQEVERAKEFELLQASAQYVFQTNKDSLSRYEILNEFKKHLKPATQKNIMTIAEAFVEDGRQVGLQEGRQEGQKKFLLKLIERRFPNQLTFNQRDLIEEADSESLSLWGEKLMDAASIGEVFIF